MSNTLISDNASLLLPDSVTVKRSDPVYMAHAYLTKNPGIGDHPVHQSIHSTG